MNPEDFGLVPSGDTGNHPLTEPKDRRDKNTIENQKEEKEDKKIEKEEKRADIKKDKSPKEEKYNPVGRPEDGRPKNSRDKQQRKQREEKPKLLSVKDLANLSLWANEAQSEISTIVNPAILSHHEKASLRSLTKSEMDQLEHLKLCILCNIEPYIDITPEVVADLLKNPITLSSSVAKMLPELKDDFFNRKDRQPNIDELRQMHVSCYALSKTG